MKTYILYFIPEITLAIIGCVVGGLYAIRTGQLDIFPTYAIIYCLGLAAIGFGRLLWGVLNTPN